MKKQKVFKLKVEQVEYLKQFKTEPSRSLREVNRANILLLLFKGKKAVDIADYLDIGRNTVSRVKQKFLNEGLEAALQEGERPGQPVKYTVKREAELIALACSNAPRGRSRWTLELLAKETKINKESIRLILKKTNVSLG